MADLIEMQKHDRKIWAKPSGIFCLNVSHQFGWEGLWVLGKGRWEKAATGPKCPCFAAVGGLSESQGSVLQIGRIKFDPWLMGTERATLLACDSIDINSSGVSLAWMIPQMRMWNHRKVFCQNTIYGQVPHIQCNWQRLTSRTYWKGKTMSWH